jgi:large subunit ribosomal protein L21
MYAVIKTGGKQHKVKAGDTIRVELLEGEPGDKVTFDPLLVVDDKGGTHVGKELTGSSVTGVLQGVRKADKIKVFKYKPKTGYARHQGHRQKLTEITIEDIAFKAKGSKPKAEAKTEDAPSDVPAEAPVEAQAEAAE